MTRDVPRPQLDDVTVGIRDVERAARLAEIFFVGLVVVLAQAGNRGLVVGLLEVHRVVDVKAAAAVGDPDLRPPEADPRPGPGHQPDPVVLAAADHGEAKDARIEPFRRFEVEHLEHQLADAGDRNPAHGETIIAAMQLETDRLLLRIPEPRDIDAYARFFADPEVVRYVSGRTRTRGETAVGVERMRRHWERHEIGLFSVVRKEDEQLLGRAGFLLWDATRWLNALQNDLDEPLETEIGWTFGREFWGNGYATEAALAALRWGFGELGLRRVISLIQRGNVASVRVAEKLGELLEQEDVPGPFAATTDLYALTLEQTLSARS